MTDHDHTIVAAPDYHRLPVVGVDPGVNGGLAAIWPNGRYFSEAMPATERDLVNWLHDFPGCVCYIEKVSSSPQMGVKSAFTFGRSAGLLHAAAIAAGQRVEFITPRKWQSEFGLVVKGRKLGEGDTAKKNRNKAKAQELFPGAKITHKTADALLIAEYARRQWHK